MPSEDQIDILKLPALRSNEDALTSWSIMASSGAMTFRKQVADWDQLLLAKTSPHSRATVAWYIECVLAGTALLKECVDRHPQVRGGRLVLKGTGFTVADTLAELSGSSGVAEVADKFNLDAQKIHDLLDGMSLLFERFDAP